MKTAIVILSVLLLSGCTSKSQLFVNSNGDVKRCSSWGTGLVGMIQANNIQNDCEQDMLNLGYRKIEDAGVVGITFNDSLRIIKVSPKTPIEFVSVNDHLVAVGGEKIYTRKEAINLLFGYAGVEVDITLNHNGRDTTQTVVREPYISIYGQSKRSRKK